MSEGLATLLLPAMVIVLIAFMFWSQRRRQNAVAQLQDSLNVGDDVCTTSGLFGRITALDEQLSKGQRELRSQMLEQHQRLTDDLRHKMEDVLATLARETGELRTDKADRTAIASLLTEMALRLTNQFRLPGAEDGGNG